MMSKKKKKNSRYKKRKKGDVGTEKEKEKEEGEKLASFFSSIHEFFVPANVPANVFTPVALPARYAIAFVSPVTNSLGATVVPSAAVISSSVVPSSFFPD